MSDTHGVEPDDTSEVNSQISFAIGVVEDKENIEICPTNNAVDKKLKVAKIMSLLYQEVVYLVQLHIYWLENVMDFTGPSQKIHCPAFLCFNQSRFISITFH